MTVDVICPLYNAEKFIINLNNSIISQENVQINEIKYILTESNDNSEEVLKKNNINYEKIKKSEFSHSLTRERAALKSKADIIVFISQDIEIKRRDWLYNLVKDIDDSIVATYSRQLTKYDGIEKYTREKNYSNKSRVISNDDIKELGLRTFFFSDASSAIKTSVFKDLNGYDQKDLPINEDMYFAYKLITNGYKIKYCADSEIYHSHKFTLKQLYNRYKLTGQFMKKNSYLDKYGTSNSGLELSKYILQRSIQDMNFKAIIRWLPDMGARYLGMKVGKK